MKIVAFLPAKGSSERIKNKNMSLLNGKPLFLHTLEKLTSCSFIDEVYLDSESDEILYYAPYLKYTPLKRDKALASNKTDGHQMFYNEVRQIDADIYIQILCTSPFIKMETIKRGIDILVENEKYDSVVLVKKEKQYTWGTNGPLYDKNHIPNSKDLDDTIIETMGLYIVRGETARTKKMRFGDSVYLLEADATEAIDVNYPDDFQLADTIAAGQQSKETLFFNSLSKHISSCILSDILWEYNIPSVIRGLSPNLPLTKVLGRASTLCIRALKQGEDFRGIYEGLNSYKYIRPGEIIIVQNECPDRAYFGELNANLAIRSGAIATIVDGVTRDATEVSSLGFPVFAKSYCCSDVRGVATIKNINHTISIQGVRINPGDLIFGDADGIVVIPRKYEKEILSKACKSVQTERTVLSKIIGNKDAFTIYLEEGAF